VQNHWIKAIRQKKATWAAYTLAAIYLREERRKKDENDRTEPSDDDIERCVEIHKTQTPRLVGKVTRDQVLAAFESGEERLNVFPMRCVGFDTKLVKDVLPALKGQRAKRGQVSGETEAETNGKGKKRSRSDSESDSLKLDSHASGAKRRTRTRRSERNDRAKEELEETDAHMSGDDEDKSGDDEDGDGQSDYDPGNTMGVATRSLASSTRPRRSTRRTT